MSHFIKAQVQAVHPEKFILELPGGATFDWPRITDSNHLSEAAIGDELTLTLTRTLDVINDLLNIEDVADVKGQTA